MLVRYTTEIFVGFVSNSFFSPLEIDQKKKKTNNYFFLKTIDWPLGINLIITMQNLVVTISQLRLFVYAESTRITNGYS
jgi:hypothetical protein